MKKKSAPFIAEIIGEIPNRLQLAGGWIDQPFVSRHIPKPPGAMIVVPDFPYKPLLPLPLFIRTCLMPRTLTPTIFRACESSSGFSQINNEYEIVR